MRKALGIEMVGDQTGISANFPVSATILLTINPSDSMWGVVDMHVETDFPDGRGWTFLHSHHGTLMNIPRENDLVRFYIQLPDDTDFVDKQTGRVDRARATPEKLIETAVNIFEPYHVEKFGEVEWWTIYISECLCLGSDQLLWGLTLSIVGQRVARSFSVKDRIFIAGDACHTHSPKAGVWLCPVAPQPDAHNARNWCRSRDERQYE